jgi:hypothetical protein
MKHQPTLQSSLPAGAAKHPWTSGRLARFGLSGLLTGSLLLLSSCSSLSDKTGAVAPSSPDPSVNAATSFSWKGHTWNVTSGGMAGVAQGNTANVFVDGNGYLHLKITNSGGSWTAAELFSTDNMGFGTYQWQIEGAVDRLDKNVVVGLYPYGPAAGIGGDGTNEIDIEFARWGNSAWPNGNYTVYPNSGSTVGSTTFNFTLGSSFTTSTFTWSGSKIDFSVQEGLKAVGDNSGLIKSWSYAPSNPTTNIPQRAMPLGMNLWCFGAPPSNGQNVEIIIRDFKFIPLGTPITKYAITASAGTGGSITPSGSLSVDQGGSQSFTIAASAGYIIKDVTVDGVSKGAITSYTFSNVQAGHSISAGFSVTTTPANIALGGTGYIWAKNSSESANSNRVAKRGVNDNNLTTAVNCNAAGEGGAARWEGAGVVWSSARTIASVKFVNGALDAYGNCYFQANCKLQFSTDGLTWTAAGWTLSPVYPNSAAAAGKTYTFSGTARSGIRGVRVVGQTGAQSWSWSVNEVQVFGQ